MRGKLNPGPRWTAMPESGYMSLFKDISPSFRKPLAILVRNLGTLEFVELDKRFSSVVIKESFDSIIAGDHLIASQDLVVPELRQDHTFSPKDIQARIMAFKERVETVARDDIVYINKGESEEVRVGDFFEIYTINHVDKEKKLV